MHIELESVVAKREGGSIDVTIDKGGSIAQ